jgi:branched-chain amino acid transport system substrate-binding protein
MAMTGLLADPVIKLVEKQVQDMGGILGGRQVKVVKYDSRGTVAEAIAGATKLLKEDKVSALVYGGASGADNIAVSDFAEANHILYVDYAGLPDLAEKKFTVTGMTTWDEPYVAEYDFTNKVLKPKTVAILAADLTDGHQHGEGFRKGVEPAGTKIVYEQYPPVGTSDFTPYLTKIKYAKPDVLLLFFQPSETYLSIAKQIMELGGWGDIKVLGTAAAEPSAKMPGAQGWYVFVLWLPGLPYPGAVKFQQDFQAMYGRMPSSVQVYFYNPLWTAIYAIDLAGTDTDLEKIAQTARSGNLEWDTPMGHAHYTPQGDAGLHLAVAHIEEGKLVLIQVPE